MQWTGMAATLLGGLGSKSLGGRLLVAGRSSPHLPVGDYELDVYVDNPDIGGHKKADDPAAFDRVYFSGLQPADESQFILKNITCRENVYSRLEPAIDPPGFW